MEAVWNAYYGGMTATDSDGRPDHRARFQAASAVLAEAYGKPVQPTEERGSKVHVQLVQLRRDPATL